MDAVVHAAAIPDPTHNTPATVFQNNMMATFNVLEAAVRFGVSRFVNISSETVPGFFFPERPFLPDYVPIDEEHPIRPQDPYALSKYFGELLMDAAVRRSDVRCITIRPCWVQHEGNYERNLGPQVRDARRSARISGATSTSTIWPTPSSWPPRPACPATRSSTSRRPTTRRALRRDGAEVLRDSIKIRALAREDASGISCAKAMKMLGYAPKRSWRDYLDEQGRTPSTPPVGLGQLLLDLRGPLGQDRVRAAGQAFLGVRPAPRGRRRFSRRHHTMVR